MTAPLSTTRKELVDGFAAGRTVVQEEWAHPQEIAWVDELIAEGKAKPAHWQYFEEFQCERRSVTGVKTSTKILTGAEAAGFSVGDIVETSKGAAFWGRIDEFYKGGTGAVVVAIAPGFEETTHVYPLAQLRHRRAAAISDRIADARDLILRLQSPKRSGCWCWPSRDVEANGHEQVCRDATAFLAEAVQ